METNTNTKYLNTTYGDCTAVWFAVEWFDQKYNDEYAIVIPDTGHPYLITGVAEIVPMEDMMYKGIFDLLLMLDPVKRELEQQTG